MCYQHMDQENSLIVETKFEKIELILDNIDLLLIIFFCSIQASLEVKSFTRIKDSGKIVIFPDPDPDLSLFLGPFFEFISKGGSLVKIALHPPQIPILVRA